MAVVYLVFAIVVAGGAVVFALQNSVSVTVTLVAWTFTGSLSLVLLVTLLIGVLIGALALLPGSIKKSFLATGLKKTIAKMEKTEKSTAEAPVAAPTGEKKTDQGSQL
jgi:putative membrane protein